MIDPARLESELEGFWAADRWDMKANPTGIYPKGKDSYKKIQFILDNGSLKSEIKFVASRKFINRDWSPKTTNFSAQLHRLSQFLNFINLKINSLLDVELNEWEKLLTEYLRNTNQRQFNGESKITGEQIKTTYWRDNRCIALLRVVYKALQDEYDTRTYWDKDIWNVKKLNLLVNPARSTTTLNFSQAKPDWLKTALKLHIKQKLGVLSLPQLCHVINVIKKFGEFIVKKYPKLNPEKIDRKLLLDYIGWINRSDLTQNIKCEYLSVLRLAFERMARDGLLPISAERLIFAEDLPRRIKRKPRYIPEYVMSQLEEFLPEFKDAQVRRMCIVLKNCGMRISELCTVKKGCLSQDREGDYFLLYYQGKMSKEHTIPVSKETVEAITEQQEYIKTLDFETEYLFPARTGSTAGNAYKTLAFSRKLNEFAVEREIKDENGKLWRFQAHQFRHTLGTRMVNNGTPLHIIQKMLGHESADMTMAYAHIHDQTLKKAFENYIENRGNLVDIAGNIVEREKPTSADSSDLQWFKRNIQAQSLPNGYCGLPAVSTACPHANACLSCASFRTDASFLSQHKQQLEQTKQLVQISRDNGWARQAEMNEKVQKNLEKIIEKLAPEDAEAIKETHSEGE